MEENKYYSVSEINEFIHELFLNFEHFQNISIRGEITNFKGANRSGHYYFSLKDEKSVISAVIFKFDSYNIDYDIKNGDDVIVVGNLSTYVGSGTYQIIIKEIYPFGKGNLLIKKEKLREKLLKEGYFDDSHKKELPYFPINIGIICGKNSAASQDFKINLLRRMPILNLKFFECLVQGEKAPEDIVKNLLLADNSSLDLIILGRGGGASDDLNAFDDENVVKAIYNLKTPSIAAIGHEINRTFSDFTADKYASTPTGACELAVIDYQDLFNNLKMTLQYIHDQVNKKIINYELEINKLKNLNQFKDINSIFTNKINYVNNLKIEIYHLIERKIDTLESKNNLNKEILNNVNPKKILEKGYVLLKDNENNYIKDLTKLNKNDELIIESNKLEIKAKVEEVKYGK